MTVTVTVTVTAQANKHARTQVETKLCEKHLSLWLFASGWGQT